MEASQQPPPRPSQPRDLEAVEDGRQSREQLMRENQELREARECRVCRDQEVGTITLDTAATTDITTARWGWCSCRAATWSPAPPAPPV